MGLLLFLTSEINAQTDSINKIFPNPIICFENEMHDFGSIKKGTTITYDFKFKNTGKAPLIIDTVTTGCDCTTAEWQKVPIYNGQTGFIHITYKSDEEGGDQAKEITVTSNAATPIKTLRFTGYVDYSGK